MYRSIATVAVVCGCGSVSVSLTALLTNSPRKLWPLGVVLSLGFDHSAPTGAEKVLEESVERSARASRPTTSGRKARGRDACDRPHRDVAQPCDMTSSLRKGPRHPRARSHRAWRQTAPNPAPRP